MNSDKIEKLVLDLYEALKEQNLNVVNICDDSQCDDEECCLWKSVNNYIKYHIESHENYFTKKLTK